MKMIVSMMFFFLPCNLVRAQVKKQLLYTDVGVCTLISVKGANDVVYVDDQLWNNMMSGTMFVPALLPVNKPVYVLIEIADKRRGSCRKGIGFSCSIIPQPYLSERKAVFVHAGNRVCYASIRRLYSGKIELTFLDKVDWASLYE